jgi:hypothetical protein
MTGMRLGVFIVVMLAAVPSAAMGQHASAHPIETEHISEARIAAFNIALTSGLTVARGLISGEIRSGRDAARHAAAGALAGYGFFESKRLIGQDHGLVGIALAHGSASFLRNVGEGRHPLASFCAGPGPLDACVRTGLDQGEGAGYRIEVNAIALTTGAVLLASGMEPRFRDGTLYFRSRNDLGSVGDFIRTGYAFGRTIVVAPVARESTWRHELIHYVQTLQIGALTPMYTAREQRRLFPGSRFDASEFSVRRWDVQIDWLFLVIAGGNSIVPYERQWNELEAYRLTFKPTENESGGRELHVTR